MASSLQANKRAQLVGAHTFGSGAVQTILAIGNQAALRLTIARMYGPTGTALDLGLQPDVSTDAELETMRNAQHNAQPLVAHKGLATPRRSEY